jgi:hypothetical protein
MRNEYSLAHIFTAIGAWERHKLEYLVALETAHAPSPSAKELQNYQRLFLEGYLESLSDAQENQNTGG